MLTSSIELHFAKKPTGWEVARSMVDVPATLVKSGLVTGEPMFFARPASGETYYGGMLRKGQVCFPPEIGDQDLITFHVRRFQLEGRLAILGVTTPLTNENLSGAFRLGGKVRVLALACEIGTSPNGYDIPELQKPDVVEAGIHLNSVVAGAMASGMLDFGPQITGPGAPQGRG